MIRDFAEKKITRELARELAVDLHISSLCVKLVVYPDGEIVKNEEPDNNWMSAQELYGFFYSAGCNCDWCAEWDAQTEEAKKYETKKEFIEACVDNNDDVSVIVEQIMENFEKIPLGFFEDEA